MVDTPRTAQVIGEPGRWGGAVALKPAVLFGILTTVGLFLVSPYLLLSSVLDTFAALVVLVPPILLGLWIVGRLPLGQPPLRWRLLLAGGIGIGVTALLMLGLGLFGVLARSAWLAMLLGFTIVGAIEARKLIRNSSSVADHGGGSSFFSYVWVLLVPFLIVALRNASNAPGFVWSEEGFGYDVLEYHLQVPQEYLQLGRIAYLPHNVYAGFPSNVEMLYLLSSIVHGSSSDLGSVAHHIHLLFGAMFVFALWVMGREWSRAAGTVAALAGGTIGWLPYLSGLAYVELGMLFFGACSLGCIQRAMVMADMDSMAKLWVAIAGVLAGFSCGCKYPGVVFIAIPLALLLLASGGSWASRWTRVVLYSTFGAASLSPWLLKNIVQTGNPVFPLLNGVFHATPPGWSVEEDARWERGHSATADESSAVVRAELLWGRTLGDPLQRLGPMVFLLGALGLAVRGANRWDWALFGVLILQVLIWALTTHLFARFALPMLLPLCALAAGGTARLVSMRGRWMVVALVVVGAGWNLAFAARLSFLEAPVAAPSTLYSKGAVPGFEYLGVINQELPADAKLLLVGESRPYYIERRVDYCVAFNKNTFAEAVRAAKEPSDVVGWLRSRGYSHVLVNWAEIGRLARTYGFPPEITPRLFDDLRGSGLQLVRSFAHPNQTTRYVELYAVPQ